MTPEDAAAEQRRLQEIQRRRDESARDMEREVQRVQAYITTGRPGWRSPTSAPADSPRR